MKWLVTLVLPEKLASLSLELFWWPSIDFAFVVNVPDMRGSDEGFTDYSMRELLYEQIFETLVTMENQRKIWILTCEPVIFLLGDPVQKA